MCPKNCQTDTLWAGQELNQDLLTDASKGTSATLLRSPGFAARIAHQGHHVEIMGSDAGVWDVDPASFFSVTKPQSLESRQFNFFMVPLTLCHAVIFSEYKLKSEFSILFSSIWLQILSSVLLLFLFCLLLLRK